MDRHSGQYGEVMARRRRLLLDARALAEDHLARAEARGDTRLVARYAAALLRAEEALATLDAALEAAEAEP